MSRKRSVFPHGLQHLIKSWHSGGNWVKPLLALLAALLCALIAPILTKTPAVGSAIPSLSRSAAQMQNLVQQGKALYEAGQFSEALKVLQQAIHVYQAPGDRLNQAMVLSNLSLVYQQLGLWSEANKAITDSLNLLQSGQNTGNPKDLLQVKAQVLNTQGRLQLSLGQPEQALSTWQQAATAYAQAGDSSGIVRSQINQAQALQSLGLYRRAVKSLNQVNQTLQKQPVSLLKTAGLLQLGNALQVVGDLEQSRQVLQQSLTLVQQLASPQEISVALLSLGNVARLQQDTRAALAFYQQAADASHSQTTKLQAQLQQLNLLLETQKWSAAQALWSQLHSQIAALPASHTTIYARINLAQSLTQLKQSTTSTSTPAWSDIAHLSATAVQQAKSIGDQRAEAYALGSLGGLYEQTQQLSSAQELTQQALLKAQAIKAPEIAYQWQWQLGRLLKAQGDIQGAIAAYTEAVRTLQSLRYDLVAMNPDIQFDFRENVEPIYRQLVELLLQSKEASGPNQQNLAQARTVIESLQLAELENFFRAACLSAQPVLIDQLLDQESLTAAVIYPIILPDRLEVILKLPQQQDLRHYVTSVPQSQVESTLEQLRQNLEQPYTAPEAKSLSQRVYDWLIRPAEADLAQSRIETLVFVPDGSLRNIPMAALYDGKQYLVQKYSVALTPGLSLLNPKPLQQLHLRALAAGLTEAHLGFSALTNVALELNQIKTEVPSTVLLDRQFTSTALQKEMKSEPYPVVHLATHGQFSSNPDETFILAWDKPIKIDDLIDLLQLRDQSKSKALELLVLSACETAAGDKRAALGLAGVAVRSGARSTLASLWNLDDESSALILSQFYRELAKTSATRAEALRRAQLTLLKNPNYRHPVYWAPYVLVGNWL